MKVFHGSKNLPSQWQRGVIALGVFDGLHLGHQAILEKIVRQAHRAGSPPLVYTFHPHPVRVLAPHLPLSLITTLPQKLELIGQVGIKAVVVERFTKRFSSFSARDFFFKILLARLHPHTVSADYNFTFGRKREGTIETLEQLGKENGVFVTIVPAVFKKRCLISSTEIRNSIRRGEVKQAATLLGHSFFIDGEVVRGRGIGQELGIHTANLKTENELIPMAGVYARTFTTIKGKRLQSVTNIGLNPTFGGTTLSVETHLLYFDQNIYRKRLRVEFVERLRDEMTFSGPEPLRRQILRDIETAKKQLKAFRRFL